MIRIPCFDLILTSVFSSVLLFSTTGQESRWLECYVGPAGEETAYCGDKPDAVVNTTNCCVEIDNLEDSSEPLQRFCTDAPYAHHCIPNEVQCRQLYGLQMCFCTGRLCNLNITRHNSSSPVVHQTGIITNTGRPRRGLGQSSKTELTENESGTSAVNNILVGCFSAALLIYSFG